MNKISHLIPATEFILQYHEPDHYETMELDRVANEIYNYATFLKQPLQEWMFAGEDRLFEGFPISDGGVVEDLLEFLKIDRKPISLTPKALEQIYGTI